MYQNIGPHKKRNNSFVEKPYTQRPGYFSLKPYEES